LKNAYQDLDLDINRHVKQDATWMLSEKAAKRNYPTRLLRYFVPYGYLYALSQKLGRPVKVCEIGIGKGQMAAFYESAQKFPGQQPFVDSFVGVDITDERPPYQIYSVFLKIDLNKEPAPTGFDVYLMLHVIEHLTEPEAALDKLAQALAPGAAIVVGVPCHPHFLIPHRERNYHKIRTFDAGHHTAHSRKRLTNWAKNAGLTMRYEDGAFLLRSSGSFLEDSKAWHGFNLAFGRAFPGFPGEYYCCAVKEG